MSAAAWPARIGIVGLGIIGSAIARNLVKAGRRPIGFDTDPARCAEMRGAGIEVASSAGAAAEASDLLLSSLPNAAALDATTNGIIAAQRRAGLVLVELSTLSLEDKLRQHARLGEAGVTMLDCPVSGTGAQAATRDIVLYVSGDRAAHERCVPAFAEFARQSVYLGAFGNGTKMKFVANLLVAVHNVAAAEAVALGMSAGLDPATLCQVLSSGAGNSRMLELRGPMMVREAYEPATMKLDVWRKDMELIAAFARGLGVATPLFSTTAPLYEAAVAAGRGNQDTAAVHAVLKDMKPS